MSLTVRNMGDRLVLLSNASLTIDGTEFWAKSISCGALESGMNTAVIIYFDFNQSLSKGVSYTGKLYTDGEPLIFIAKCTG